MIGKLRLAAAVLAAGTMAMGAAAAQDFFTIGTGGVTGVYFPAGGAICRLVNKGRRDHGLRCAVESTDGSVANLEAIRAGTLAFGVVQSDWQYHAYNGTSSFAAVGPDTELRAVLALHPEPFTVVAREEAGIAALDDLPGKRVNIGNPGSGQRGTMEVVMEARGWSAEDFAEMLELPALEQSAALCDDRIDAMVYVVGHPSGSIQEATTSCNGRLVEVAGPEIDALVAGNSFYRAATIPGGLYRGNPEDVTTFGVGATLVTSAAVPEATVYAVVRSVFENLDDFRRLHPALANLSEEEMIAAGLSAPLHDGAARYYRERGWIE